MLPEQQCCSEKTGAAFPQKHALSSPIQLKRNSFWGMARSIAITLVFAASYPLYIRFLGLEVFGVWVMLMAVETYLHLGVARLPEGAIKFISEALMQNNMAGIRRYSSSLTGAILFTGLVILGLALLGGQFLATYFPAPGILRQDLPLMIILTALIILMALMGESLGAIISGIGRMDQVYLVDICNRMVALLISFTFLVKEYGLMSLFYGSITGYLVSIIMLIFFIRRTFNLFPIGVQYFSWPHLRQLAIFSWPLIAGALLYCMVRPFNRLLLGYLISPAAASIFEIADRGAILLRSHAETSIRPLMPMISGMKAMLGDGEKINRFCIDTIKMIIIWVTPLFITFLVVINYLLPFWLHTDAVPDININLHILLWGYYANLITVPIYYVFMGRGHSAPCFYTNLILAITNVVVGILGICLVRQIWVISWAATMGLTLASLLLMLIYFGSWRATLNMMVKGVRLMILPVLSFAPLLLIWNNLLLCLVFSVVICAIYFLLVQKYGKIRLFIWQNIYVL